ncbi:MAG: zinc ribbon domain-containing protein [Eubacteriales bacterium]
MSDFFDKLKKNIDKGVSKASKKSAEIAEKTKLQTQIMSLKNDKKNEINDLGKVTYEMLREDNLDEEILNLKFESIMEIEKQIKDKEEQKENIEKEELAEKTEEAQEFEETGEVESDQIFCPNCGEKNSSDAKFCKNCGTKLND